MPRFVVQEHFTDPHHFDVMLERGAMLATWSMPDPPELAPPAGAEAIRIQDHRPLYLDYEGEISGGRGRVRIHDRGDYDVELWSDTEVRVSVRGSLWSGRWRLIDGAAVDAQGRRRWCLARAADDEPCPTVTPRTASE